LPASGGLTRLWQVLWCRVRVLRKLINVPKTFIGTEEATVTDEKLMNRITVNPKIFGGKPIARGMRISVELILSLLAQGETTEELLKDYPDLEVDDIRACLAYAHAVIARDSLDSVRVIAD
jgi:uncharacterized protein (DUF433 family)